jgi:hypothetical protein
MSDVRLGQKVYVTIPTRGVAYPAKVVGYSRDRLKTLLDVDVQICEGYRHAAGVEFANVEPTAITRRFGRLPRGRSA